jgi:hypothetical protein
MKLELLTNATVVDDDIRFVSQKSKENLKSSGNSNEDDKEESNEPDYDGLLYCSHDFFSTSLITSSR